MLDALTDCTAIDAELTEFDNKLWLAVVASLTAKADGRLMFRFCNGTEVTGWAVGLGEILMSKA